MSGMPEPQSSGANALAPQMAAQPNAAPQIAVPQNTPMVAGDARQRLHAVLSERGLTFLADAVENSQVTESGNELKIITGKLDAIHLKDRSLPALVQEVFGRPMRITVTVGEVQVQSTPMAAPKPAAEDEATTRAMSNPEVQRFREVFGGEVRKVRNLKE